MKYKLIIDLGKPYEEDINTNEELEKELKRIKKLVDTEKCPYADVKVFNSDNEDITESQFIQEMVWGGEE